MSAEIYEEPSDITHLREDGTRRVPEGNSRKSLKSGLIPIYEEPSRIRTCFGMDF